MSWSIPLKQILEATLLAAGGPLGMDRLLELFADEERPEPKRIREVLDELAGDYQGRDAICALLDRMNQASQGTLRFETDRSTARVAEDVRLCGRIHGRRRARQLQVDACIEATVAGDTIREVWLACSDQPAWDAFWS